MIVRILGCTRSRGSRCLGSSGRRSVLWHGRGSAGLWQRRRHSAAAPAPRGLPLHLCPRDGPGVPELAWFARQAYNAVEDRRPPIDVDGWRYEREWSLSVPSEGVHVQCWRKGDDIVVACRGTTFDEVAHVLGNLGLVETHSLFHQLGLAENVQAWLQQAAKTWGFEGRLVGGPRVRDHVQDVLEAHPGCRVWLTGHSRGAALLEYAGLSLSDDVFAVVGFESPGLPASMLEAEAPGFVDSEGRFVTFFTCPNIVNTLNPSINANQRFHIPAYPTHAPPHFFAECVLSDAARAFNWATIAVPAARLSSSALARACSCAGFATASGHCTAWAGALAGVQAHRYLTYASHLRNLNFSTSFHLSWEDFKYTHEISGIVDCLYHRGGVGAIKQIRRWPSDSQVGSRLPPASLGAGWQFVRNQVLFGQDDLPGVHQLGFDADQIHVNYRSMWKARMYSQLGSHWELGDRLPAEGGYSPIPPVPAEALQA